MSEFGGLESFTPGEGAQGASEQVSEQAKQRFAQSQQQIKQIAKEEKKAKKRDDRVAITIKQFLSDDTYAHLFQLISRLAARDCPSIFILALLSLIHDGATSAVEEYIAEKNMTIEPPEEVVQQTKNDGLSAEARRDILIWTTRLELIVNIEGVKILSKLMVDENNIDGSVLQLTTFVLVDYFTSLGRIVSYQDLEPLTIKILQDILEEHLSTMEKYFQALREEVEGKEDDDDEITS